MKKFLSVLLSCILILGVTSCKKSRTDKTQTADAFFIPTLDTEKQVSLNIVGCYGNFEALEQVITDFNMFYPNVFITYEYASRLESTTEIRCASGDNIDLVFIYTNEYDYHYKALSDKYLVNLDEFIDFSMLDQRAIENTRQNGKLFYFPIYVQSFGLLVNTTLLDKYNISVPSNRYEFEDACEKLLSKGITPVYANDRNTMSMLLNPLVFDIMSMQNREEIIEDLNNGIFHKEIMEGSINMLNKWIEKGYFDFSGNALANPYDSLIMRFLEGDLPFVTALSDTISGCKKREARSKSFTNKPFKYTYIPTPTGDKGFEAVFLPSLLFGVCNVSKNLDYAKEFMRFMNTVQELETLVTIKGMPSTYEHTDDYRISYFEKLRPEERYYIGENGLSRRVMGALVYVLPELEHDKTPLEITAANFEATMTKERKKK